MRPRALLLAAALAASTACGSGGDGSARTLGPAPGGTVELTRSGGCGEAFLWAATEDGTTVVTVGVGTDRYSTTDPVVVAVDLADPEVDGALLRGDGDLTRNLCVDVLDDDAEPDGTVALAAGAGELVIGTIPTDVPACGNVDGTLDLDGVEATDGTTIGSVHAETGSIGCFAG